MTWELIAQSFKVLCQDKKLILFPILSAVAAIAVGAGYFSFLFGTGVLQKAVDSHRLEPAGYVWLFLWYTTTYFVMVFFNCALAACAQVRFSGGEPTLADGLRRAAARSGPILLWAAISATVGIILRAIEERAGWVGRIMTAIFGLAWGVATYLIVPVLVLEEIDVVASIKRSSGLLRKTWGEQIVYALSMGWLMLLFLVPGFVLGALAMPYYPLGLAVPVLYFLLLAAVMAAMRGIFEVALYRYATTGEAAAGYSIGVLNGAFVKRPQR